MSPTRARLLLVIAAACAALAGFWLGQLERGSPQLTSGTWLPQAKAVADFSLIDTSGRPFTRRELAGAPTLVFFGFTHCPDVCPTTLSKLARLLRLAPVRQPAALGRLRVVFISVDPQRDTPRQLATYVHAFDPQFEGLTGDSASIARIAANFGVAVNRVELPGGDYTMDHSAVVFLLDDAARIVAIFTPPFEVAPIAADLERAAPFLARARAKT
ncbi:MAG TPA: SCO family protein [Steroidobacteraceae bacterium]|nr:SCO family protein [Steroidobacteraceae bacterium]